MTRFRKIFRRFPRRVFGLRSSRFLAFLAFTTRPVRLDRDRSHVILSAPGGGNIGDQAMAEAAISALRGPVVLVVRHSDNFIAPPELADRVTVVPIPGLLYGDIASFARSLPRLRRLLNSARSVSVIGADIMDGAYSARGSMRRSLVAELAARAGIPSRIFGFSWNGQAHADAVTALRGASGAGVELYLRDPLSAERAIADGLPARQAADLVFTSRPAVVARPSKPLALVNVSGLIGRSIDQVPHYDKIVRNLLDAGFSVTFVPHVSRAGGDDISCARDVFDRFAGEDVRIIERLMTPTEIRELCATASVTVTGRMHLAIMSLLAGVPPITFETQGKVMGLMSLFGAEQLRVSVGDTMGDDAVAVFQMALPQLSALSDGIAEALPRVVELAQANFVGFDAR